MMQLQKNITLQGGKYKIERLLGQGGFGNTYSGYNTTFDEHVAIKEFFMQGVNKRDDSTGIISVSLAENVQQFEEQREKFKKEALRIRKLNNPHIIRVYDLFEENGTAYYVMEYVDGENLAERLRRIGRPMTEQEVSEIFPQILDALKTVHDAGIWHLDLKPANIMVDKAGNIKLIDFGASKQLNTQKGGATTSTAISYTNGYAPREEMEQNYDKFGPWTDIYALGATLYNLLTNNRPPLPTDIDDDMSEDKHIALPFPDSINDDLKYSVLWMMKTNRQHRPQSIDAIMGADEDTIIAEPQKREKRMTPSSDSKAGGLYRQDSKKEKDRNSEKRLVFIRWIIIIIAFFIIVFFLSSRMGYNRIFLSDDKKDTTAVKVAETDVATNDSVNKSEALDSLNVMRNANNTTNATTKKSLPQKIVCPNKKPETNTQRSKILDLPVRNLHQVQPGETIYMIAEREYGRKDYAKYIIEYNGISQPDIVDKGSILKIPEIAK